MAVQGACSPKSASHSSAVRAAPPCRGHGTACGRLVGGRDRVFEVQNDRVGIERQRIGYAPGMIAGRKQKTA